MSTADDLRDMSAHLRAHPEANLRDEFDTLLWLLIEAFSKSADDLAEAGRNDKHVVRAADDGAGKGSTAARTGARSDAQPAEAPGEGRSEMGPQKGVQRLADEMREFAVGLAGGTWVPGHAARVAEGFADRAEAVEAERDRLDAWKREALMVLERYDDLARRMVPDGRLGAQRSTLLAEHVDALTADLERTAEAADRAAVRLREVERERDEARDRVRRLDAQIAGDESLRGGSWKALRAERDEWKRRAEAPLIDHKRCEALQQRAEKAEAAVARVRKVLPELVAIYRATNAAAPVVAALVAARVLVNDALDGSGLSLDTAVEVDR